MTHARRAPESPSLLIDSLSPLLGILGVLALFLLLRVLLLHGGIHGSTVVRAAGLGPSAGVNADRIAIRLTGGGTIHLQGKRLDLVSVRNAVADARLIRHEAGVLVVVEEGARASLIARVLDQVQAAGVSEVRVALAPESTQDEP